jgi:Skp family chaperone for outer membrane proteins
MKKQHIQSLIFAAIAVSLVGVGYVGAQNAGRKGGPSSVGVVDVKKVFDALDEKQQVELDMNARRQKLAAESNKRKAELEQLKADLEGILKPGTAAYNEKRAELEEKSILFQAWVQFQNRKLAAESIVQTEALYKKMVDAIATVSRANQYDIVMFKEREVNFRGAKPETLAAVIQVRKVLWASDGLDITDLVSTRMNNDYKNKPEK